MTMHRRPSRRDGMTLWVVVAVTVEIMPSFQGRTRGSVPLVGATEQLCGSRPRELIRDFVFEQLWLEEGSQAW